MAKCGLQPLFGLINIRQVLERSSPATSTHTTTPEAALTAAIHVQLRQLQQQHSSSCSSGGGGGTSSCTRSTRSASCPLARRGSSRLVVVLVVVVLLLVQVVVNGDCSCSSCTRSTSYQQSSCQQRQQQSVVLQSQSWQSALKVVWRWLCKSVPFCWRRMEQGLFKKKPNTGYLIYFPCDGEKCNKGRLCYGFVSMPCALEKSRGRLLGFSVDAL